MTAAAAPNWFTAALAAPGRESTVEAGGVPIHYLEWGAAESPGLLLVHGGAAHAHWWSFLAPLLADRWHCAALDLSGHGDSGRRESYSLEAWAEEVRAVVEEAAFPDPPVVVGHSMGGLVAAQAALDFGDHLAGVVLVDAPLKRPDPESQEGARRPVLRAASVYPTRAEAVARFRLLPAQPVSHRFLLEHVAAHSVHEVPGGWTWKFDPVVFRRQRLPVGERLPGAGCRLALIYGEHSAIVPSDVAAYTGEMMGPGAPVIPIAGAHHHVLLDRPLEFLAALQALLLSWGHAAPPEGA